ncbi:hypothetical protein YC2023_052481 [Brassica napus]
MKSRKPKKINHIYQEMNWRKFGKAVIGERVRDRNSIRAERFPADGEALRATVGPVVGFYLFLVACFCSGFLDLIGFWRRTSLRWSSDLFLGRGGFFSTFFAGFGYREAVAPSASLSPASASGRRWLPQHRWRRLSPRVFPHFDLRI